MIKSDLVLKIYAERNPHLYQRDVENIVNAILDTIADALARGDRVELRGFEAFLGQRHDAHTPRNPRTGETVSVSEKVIPVLENQARRCASGSTRPRRKRPPNSGRDIMRQFLKALVLLPIGAGRDWLPCPVAACSHDNGESRPGLSRKTPTTRSHSADSTLNSIPLSVEPETTL